MQFEPKKVSGFRITGPLFGVVFFEEGTYQLS